MESLHQLSHSPLTRGIFVVVCVLVAALVRLFSVLRYESVIHEFDPYFNYRASKYLLANGLDSFNNWFDETSWYPLGRIVGATVYPGLMYTSVFFFRVLEFFHLTVDIKDICVFMGPFFAGLTVLVGYHMTQEIASKVAGSYDNECISIFALLLTFYLWVKSVKSGNAIHAALAALSYYYMALSWGAYVFIINLIPLHAFLLLIMGRFTTKLYTAFTTFYAIGILLSMQVTFIGFQPIRSSEHMAAINVFFFALIGGVVAVVILTLTGKISPWTGRFYALLDPTYAKEHIPIIASVSEHQPTSWGSYYFDLHIIVFFIPVGIYFLLKDIRDETIFLILLVMTTVYFSGVMSRLVLILSTAACICAAIGISKMFDSVSKMIYAVEKTSTKKKEKNSTSTVALMKKVGIYVAIILSLLLFIYSSHGLSAGRDTYSSPSLVMKVPTSDGNFVVFDDFRDSYRWLNENTPTDSKVMSWWDYGYQLAAIANRTTIVDNNTWNNSHIARVGGAFAKPEAESYKILKELDVDYVLVIFGGVVGYGGDDINKFPWMIRIGGTIDSSINERDYITERGEFDVGVNATESMRNSLMYKLCYYRFGELMTEQQQPIGFDRARQKEIGKKDLELNHLEEVYTSVHWMVRIYKVKKDNNRIWDTDSLSL
ncbi:dolichyl-diphosphooligosaccharide--protein glycotransferase [Entamoeba marina]